MAWPSRERAVGLCKHFLWRVYDSVAERRGCGVVVAERSVPELMLTKENTIESRFSYRMPSLFFRPFIK